VTAEPLRAPFPWFGGKRTVASEIWSRLGDTPNYVEPFAGSAAVLLARPHAPRTETINDADGFVSNFWRAVQADPEGVAAAADWPVNERDLEARHAWLVTEGRATLARLGGDPLGYDARIAGWWVWGACAWIGSGWCSGKGPWSWTGEAWQDARQLPHVGDAGQGINRQLPHVGSAGQGINRQLPHVGDAGRGAFIRSWIGALSERLRDVRVLCGDWSRAVTESLTTRHGLTAVLLDPPYGDLSGRAETYTHDSGTVAAEVRAWALANGNDSLLRIALCGYDGEHTMPGWTAWRWKARGGYGSQSDKRGRANAARETIWFSPHCLVPVDADPPKAPRRATSPSLFAEPAA